MPTYQFRCPDGTIIERMFKISEVPPTIPAPDGSGDAVRMISGGAGLIFKGSGFYITDYGKDGKKDQRPAATPDGAPSASTSASESPATSSGAAPSSSAAPSTPAKTDGGSGSGSSSGA